jgi:hypothetical protein
VRNSPVHRFWRHPREPLDWSHSDCRYLSQEKYAHQTEPAIKVRTALVGEFHTVSGQCVTCMRESAQLPRRSIRRKPLSATQKLPRHLIAWQSGGLRFRQPAAASRRASCKQAFFRKIHRNERLTMAGGHSATNRALPTSARRRSLTTKVVEGCLCPVSFLLSRGQLADGES